MSMPLCGGFTAMAVPSEAPQSKQATISGTVLDESNEPIIGASVKVKGQKTGVNTNFEGNFTIKATADAQLVISFVGYNELTVNAKDGMIVYMQPTTQMLNELVAVGYGTQKRANLTGAVATVDVERVMDSRAVQDVTKALQGAVPGLTIVASQGGIASDATINIRGLGTMSNGQTSNPLIVVDGVPCDDLNYLNPEDIQDISVLKDAASSSIYGSRAAFGVILITTKHANTKDKVKLTYTNNFAWSGATTYPHMALNSECIDASLQAYARTGAANGLSTEVSAMNYLDMLPYVKAWEQQHDNKGYTDYRELQPFESWDNVGDYYVDPTTGKWLHYAMWDVNKTVFTNHAPSQKHNVSIEGTSGQTQYRMSFGYDSKEGLQSVRPDEMKRYMANMSVSTQVFSFLKAGARMNFSQRDYTEPWTNRYAYEYVWRWPSYEEQYGYLINPTTGEQIGTRDDITDRLQGTDDHTRTRQTRLQAWMEATFTPELSLHADYTYDIRNLRNEFSRGYFKFINWGQPQTGVAIWDNIYEPYSATQTYAQKSASEATRWTLNVYGNYTKTFADVHNLKVMLGGNAEKYEYTQFAARRFNLLDYSMPVLGLTDGLDADGGFTNLAIPSTSDTHRATAGFFGRINYDYKGIYLLELNGRYDGSSRFPAADQWAFFPSASAGYRFTEENYFKPIKDTGVITNGKVRASWGQVGNEAIGSNMFISTISRPSAVNWLNAAGTGTLKGQGLPSLVSSTLTWERIITTDVGLDLGLFNNSLNMTFDWYSRETRDMLAPGAELPQVLGATAPYQNEGRLRTNGWELGISWNHSFGEADVWANFSIGDARTKVTKWNNPQETLYSYRIGSGSNTNRLYEGQIYGDIWGFEFDRFFEESDFNGKDADGNWIRKDGIASQKNVEYGAFTFGPGDVKFVDRDGDGELTVGIPDSEENRLKYPELVDPETGKLYPIGTAKNHGDLKVIGNAMPRYEYSFRIGGAWKGFDIDLFFQGVGARKFYLINNFVIPQCQGQGNPIYEHQIKEGFNRYVYDENFQITGYEIDQNNLYPVLYPGCFGYSRYRNTLDQGQNNFTTCDRWLTNMAYLRLKTMTVGYTLPYDITKHALIQRARVYFSAENPFFIYNGAGKFGIDPELSTASRGQSSAAGVGAMGRTNPMMRTYSFGLQVTF